MASLTETANQLKGHTILYFPSDDLSDTDRVCRVCRRLLSCRARMLVCDA